MRVLLLSLIVLATTIGAVQAAPGYPDWATQAFESGG
jgi:hypothetical protein